MRTRLGHLYLRPGPGRLTPMENTIKLLLLCLGAYAAGKIQYDFLVWLTDKAIDRLLAPKKEDPDVRKRKALKVAQLRPPPAPPEPPERDE